MQGGFHPHTDDPHDPVPVDEVPMLVLRAAKAMVERMAKPVDGGKGPRLTAVHALAARYIDEHTGVTTVDVAAHLHITKQSASEVVKALEDVGAVVRRPHPDDRRARIVELTPHGRTRLDESRARWAALEREWADLVGSDALSNVRDCLTAYLAANEVGSPAPV